MHAFEVEEEMSLLGQPIQFTYPGGKVVPQEGLCTVIAANLTLRPDVGKKWVLMSASVGDAALDAGRVFELLTFDGTTTFLIAPPLTVASNVEGIFDLSQIKEFIVTRDEYLLIRSAMAGTDVDHPICVMVRELDE